MSSFIATLLPWLADIQGGLLFLKRKKGVNQCPGEAGAGVAGKGRKVEGREVRGLGGGLGREKGRRGL